MTKWKDQAAQLGMGTVVAGLKTVQSGVSKKKYKRLLATAGGAALKAVARLGRKVSARLKEGQTSEKEDGQLVAKA